MGGDLYDVFLLKDEKVGVVIGDVADKGVPSAIFMARAHALIMAEADMGLTAGEVMRVVNRHITRLQKSTQFVTVLYGILDLKTREFSYARAGHEPPLLLHPDGTVERIPHSSGMALGLWDAITLDERTLILPQGSTFLLFTDGTTLIQANSNDDILSFVAGDGIIISGLNATVKNLTGRTNLLIHDSTFSVNEAQPQHVNAKGNVWFIDIMLKHNFFMPENDFRIFRRFRMIVENNSLAMAFYDITETIYD